MQGGRFDSAGRTFFSIGDAWQNCLYSPSNVKELIPEFFYNPEFLINSNGFDLGVRSDGRAIGHVELPAWAPSADEFVRLHRLALESAHVSAHLHLWIDLIFGYRQRGREAELADNVFFHLTYEGNCDLDSIHDAFQRQAVVDQLCSYGQTPKQLFDKPHPQRQRRSASVRAYLIFWSIVGINISSLRPHLAMVPGLVECRY